MKLLNTGNRSLGLPSRGAGAIVLEPDVPTKVSAPQLAEFRKNRTVGRWLESGLVQILDDDGEVTGVVPETDKPKVAEADDSEQADILDIPDHVPEHGVFVDHVGGGMYHVWVNGIRVTDEKVRGKAAAQEVAAEYENPED